MAVTRVVIVEDEALFRELLRRSLSAEAGLEIVGVAEDGETAIQLARELTPDAVLMDIELAGDLDGIEAARRTKQERPQAGIVILFAHKDRRLAQSHRFDVNYPARRDGEGGEKRNRVGPAQH